jgi:hypothetical protein
MHTRSKSTLRTALLSVVALVAWIGVASQSALAQLTWQSQPQDGYTIQEIIDAGGLQVGDKLFHSFDVVSVASVGVIKPDASTITVRGFIDINGDVSIEFNGGWAVFPGESLDTNIDFAVTAGPGWYIEGVELALGTFGAVGNGRLTISEVIRDQDKNFIDSMLVFHRANPLLQLLQDSSTFDPLKTIYVSKDILLQGSTNGVVQLSRFTQTFKQVPEPGTLALAALGTSLILFRRRRQA